MATILTKKSDTASSVPLVADLTNAAGGAELAVNTADKRLFTKTSGGTVVELGTNPSSMTLPNGTANGVTYLNGSKVLTSGTALTFDGTKVVNGDGTGAAAEFRTSTTNAAGAGGFLRGYRNGSPSYLVGDLAPITGGAGGGLTAYVYGANPFSVYTNGSERLQVDSSGNLGLGVTPSALGTSYKGFEFGGGGSWLFGGTSAASQTYLTANSYFNGTSWVYKNTAEASYYAQSVGLHKWYIAPSGTAGNAITFTQAMTLNASGYLGIGIANASYKFHVSGASGAASVMALTNDNTGVTYRLYNANTGDNGFNGFGIYDGSAYRMIVDSSGNLLVGTTSANGVGWTLTPAGSGQIRSSGTGAQDKIQFANSSGVVGAITTSGTTTAYNTSSDYRLKENIAPMTGALAKVAALKPVTYTWKVDGSAGEGFIAHELAEVCPSAVTGEKDGMRTEQYEISPAVPATFDAEGNELTPAVEAVMGERQVPAYQGIDVSFLVGTLTAGLQELLTQQIALKAEFDAYKAAHP